MRRMLAVGVLLATSSLALGVECTYLKTPSRNPPVHTTVTADDPNTVYLAVVGGETPVPDDCGLAPSNDPAEHTGWGGPLDYDNASIGEGPGTRSFLTIGGMRFERGIGTHGLATLTYDLTGNEYASFSAYVGIDDEKDGGPTFVGECGHGGTAQFVFEIDGSAVYTSEMLSGVKDGANVDAVHVRFDIPSSASALTIRVLDGGDDLACDHTDIGDAKLVLADATAVDPRGKTAATWGVLKN